MQVKLVEHPRPPGRAFGWTPFDDVPGLRRDWWVTRQLPHGHAWLSAISDGTEVARVEIERDVRSDPYEVAPTLGPSRQIYFIEVNSLLMRSGVGTSIVGALTQRYHTGQLVAFSSDANGFWDSLGWKRFDHPEDPRMSMPLFVQVDFG